MNYDNQAKLATDIHFIQRVRQAAISAAIAISHEAPTDKEPVDDARLSFATRLLRDPNRHARIMAYGVVTYGSVSETCSDVVINNAIASLWNAYAGVNPAFTAESAAESSK